MESLFEEVQDKTEKPTPKGGKRHKYSDKFEELWLALPPHARESKWECWGIWKRMKLERIADTLIASAKDQQGWEKFAGNDLQFMKRGPSWLRMRRWEDERPPEKPKKSGGTFLDRMKS